MYESQPAIPGLDGPEWLPVQPSLPFETTETELDDHELVATLDTLHEVIDAAERQGEAPELIDVLLHEQLMQLAVERGLMRAADTDEAERARLRLEANIATVRENLNNPFGLREENAQELHETLAGFLAEYRELVEK
jgi:hypothetical protein